MYMKNIQHIYIFVCCCLATIFITFLEAYCGLRDVGVAHCKIGQLRKDADSKQISYIHDLNWGAFDHASHAPQLKSCTSNYYIHEKRAYM